MSIKPFSEVVNEEKREECVTTPFFDEARGGVEVEAAYLEETSRRQENFVMRSINFLGSFRGVFVMFVLFTMTVLIVDALGTFQDLVTSGSVLDMVYLTALVLLLSALSIVTYKNYRQIMMLKSATRHQKAFKAQKEHPDKKIVPLTLGLLERYENSGDDGFKKRAGVLRERISSSHDYREIYRELDEDVLEVVDLKVQNAIKAASAQAALSTAISPLALLDAAIVIWRGVRLTKEVAQLYGFKPGWISTIVLLKKGAFTIFFVGATELAVEYVNAASESTIVSKISLSAGQGISNGVLLARIGYGVMTACRPLPMRVKRGSFISSMAGSIKDAVMQSSTKGQHKT